MNDYESKKREVFQSIYMEAGVALFDCQTFEHGIAYLLYLLSKSSLIKLSPDITIAIMENEAKKTAGQLISLLKKHIDIEAPLDDFLIKALDSRNRLIHRYFIENIERMLKIEEHDNIIEEIRILRKDVYIGYQQLDPLVKLLASKIDNIDINQMQDSVKKKVMSWP